eukprot:gb/GECG01002506.1/.p1 GENE.gb/GECG01002506.1/~~gb/GECG01002506.1/.p1  ORF type:complete len:669 (+),score=77.53 gb/GECG01002506.1/:1-2007(+)
MGILTKEFIESSKIRTSPNSENPVLIVDVKSVAFRLALTLTSEPPGNFSDRTLLLLGGCNASLERSVRKLCNLLMKTHNQVIFINGGAESRKRTMLSQARFDDELPKRAELLRALRDDTFPARAKIPICKMPTMTAHVLQSIRLFIDEKALSSSWSILEASAEPIELALCVYKQQAGDCYIVTQNLDFLAQGANTIQPGALDVDCIVDWSALHSADLRRVVDAKAGLEITDAAWNLVLAVSSTLTLEYKLKADFGMILGEAARIAEKCRSADSLTSLASAVAELLDNLSTRQPGSTVYHEVEEQLPGWFEAVFEEISAGASLENGEQEEFQFAVLVAMENYPLFDSLYPSIREKEQAAGMRRTFEHPLLGKITLVKHDSEDSWKFDTVTTRSDIPTNIPNGQLQNLVHGLPLRFGTVLGNTAFINHYQQTTREVVKEVARKILAYIDDQREFAYEEVSFQLRWIVIDVDDPMSSGSEVEMVSFSLSEDHQSGSILPTLRRLEQEGDSGSNQWDALVSQISDDFSSSLDSKSLEVLGLLRSDCSQKVGASKWLSKWFTEAAVQYGVPVCNILHLASVYASMFSFYFSACTNTIPQYLYNKLSANTLLNTMQSFHRELHDSANHSRSPREQGNRGRGRGTGHNRGRGRGANRGGNKDHAASWREGFSGRN